MWSGSDVDASSTVSVLEGIRAKAGAGTRVEHAAGVQIRKQNASMFDGFLGGKPPAAWTDEQGKAEFAKAVEVAGRAGMIILVLGELALMSGELASQASLELPGRQQELMAAVAATGKPVILVLVNGRRLNITWAAEHIPAILEAWHPGMEGGNAIADLLFGDANPGGKLPLSWPRSVGQVPVYYAHNLTHQPESREGFTSRYWDQSGAPLYPFGYGLSYTMAGSASRPLREPKGFGKVWLGPGEKTVHFSLGKSELSYWSAPGKGWVQEADAAATLHTEFKIDLVPS